MKKSELVKIIKEEVQNTISENVSELKQLLADIDRATEKANQIPNGPTRSATLDLVSAVRRVFTILYNKK